MNATHLTSYAYLIGLQVRWFTPYAQEHERRMMASALFFLASLCVFCGVVGFLLIVKGSSK